MTKVIMDLDDLKEYTKYVVKYGAPKEYYIDEKEDSIKGAGFGELTKSGCDDRWCRPPFYCVMGECI